MSFTLNINSDSTLRKHSFTVKPKTKDGLILQLHHITATKPKPQKVRFVSACFHLLEHILAVGDHTGNVFLINFFHMKFWRLTNVNSCTVLKFSEYNGCEIIIGITNGNLYIINIDSGQITAQLLSHSHPVTDISFARQYLCLTSSSCEAIIWDLRSNSKLQVLLIEHDRQLKHVSFMPITSNILTCFEDDMIHIWKCETFESYKQILPTSWNKHSLKTIAFTKNGRIMILGGHSQYLAVFSLDTWTILKTIILPDFIKTVKKISFVSQPFDGGSNKILIILSGNGILYFYDIEMNSIINSITAEQEISKFSCSFDGKYSACILTLGETNIYDITRCTQTISRETLKTDSKNTINIRRSSSLILVQQQMKEVLEIDKLRAILKEFGQYPEAYRLKIWTQILQLPDNKRQYNAIINNSTKVSFENLEKDYPLYNKIAFKNLKRVLSNLVTWCPFFSQVTFLPIFVFPFVKVFQNEPVLCFEAICTIIVNWCQHWFEYYPLPPINTLAMVESVLYQHDLELLSHLTKCNITSNMYAWPLLEATFSEAFTASDWCILWDHILTNEPSFLLMCPVAYNMVHRNTLLNMRSSQEFEMFYHNQNVTDLKRFISKSYWLVENTMASVHPRQYLSFFKKLEPDRYPVFIDFPKAVIDQLDTLDSLNKEKISLRKHEDDLRRRQGNEKEKLKQYELKEEENGRLLELENKCREKMDQEQGRVKQEHKRLMDLRKRIHQEEIELMNSTREQIVARNSKERQFALQSLLSTMEQNKKAEELDVMKTEGELLKHYSELLRHKADIEQLLTPKPMPGPRAEHLALQKQQQQLAQALEEARDMSSSKSHLKQLNIALGIAAMDDLIQKVEMELAKEMAERYDHMDKSQASVKLLKLEAETKDLEMEVSKLLKLLADTRMVETKSKMLELQHSFDDRKQLTKEQVLLQREMEQQLKRKESQLNIFGKDFKRLKELITSAHDGYEARPSSPSGR